MKSPAETLNFRQSLLEFLEAGPGHEEALLEEFERKKSQGDPLYSSLLYLLTHLNFTERQAARHWKKSHQSTGIHFVQRLVAIRACASRSSTTSST